MNSNNYHFRYLKDVVYGANDGIITTFAVAAGVAGASLSPLIVLLLGFANLLADGFSMAASNYLGGKSELDISKEKEKSEAQQIKTRPAEEKGEIREILKEKGYAGEDIEKLVILISKNEGFWIDLMLHEELKIVPAKEAPSPQKTALATFIAFIFAGSIPLIPYIFTEFNNPFAMAIWFTAGALFIIGSLRSIFTGKKWFLAGAEMLIIGGIAALIAFGVGFGLKQIVG